MTAKAKRTPRTKAGARQMEEAAFLAALKRHGQVQESDGPLKPGVTHVLKPARAKGKAKPVRKRFSVV